MSSVLPIKEERYCKDCPHRELEIIQQSLFADGIKTVTEAAAQCKHADLCNTLWNHLLDYAEEEDIEDYDDDLSEDDDDWSFTSDASWEDRQI